MKPSTGLFLSAVMCFAGCTHTQLRKNTVRQSWTVGEIQQQQVLDNLAMFVCDHNALPSFSYPNQSGSNVTDVGSAGITSGWSQIVQGPRAGQFLFSALGLSLTTNRTAQEGFTLQPVNDPRRLELMRCAYQRAVASCGCGPESQSCPDCQAIFNKFYTGDPNGDITDHAHGIVTSECLKSPCWFHVGCKKCVPKDCECVGHYCGTYVWVLPEGRDELTKLTLAILDYAINNAPVGLTKQVVYYIDEYGVPTQQKLAVGQVTAVVAIDEQNASLLDMTSPKEVLIEQNIKTRLKQVNVELDDLQEKLKQSNAEDAKTAGDKGRSAPKNDPDFEKYKQLLADKEILENKMAYLGEQLRTPALKQRFAPVGPSPSQGTPVLQFNLQQSTLTNPIFSSPP
ncbi:MAG TPA: hypothetical protein VMR25_22320 [Planctomycetaceae bacterium]|jgi:hypothetical protein|nr:hypothetical protein [Planctomycetaceae bacterium]